MDLTTTPIDSGTILGAVAVIVSLIISGIGLYRSLKLDQRAAKKQDIDTVIENYKLLLTESKARELKLETVIERQASTIEKQDQIIDEYRITITRLENENSDLKRELTSYREAKSA